MVHKSHPEALIHPDLLATGHPTAHTGHANHTSITGDDGLALDGAIGTHAACPAPGPSRGRPRRPAALQCESTLNDERR